MNKIEEKIKKLCPEGVKKVKLGDVCEFNRGNTITKKDTIEGSVPVIAGGKTPAYYHNEANRHEKTVVVAGSGAYAGYVSFWKCPIFLSDAFSVDPKDDMIPEFLFLLLESKQKQIYTLQKGAGVPHVHGKDLSQFPIPLPPLSVQQEIVRVLDSFSSLQSKLEEELEARQKQMEYYREKLLTFGKDDKSVKWMKLGDCIVDCFSGATPSTTKKEYWDGGTIPWMSSGEVHKENVYSVEKNITKLGFDNCSTRMVPVNSVVIALAGQGKTRGCVAVTKIPLCTNQSLCSIVTNSDIIRYDYLYYYLKNKYMELRNISSGDGTRGGLNLTMIKNYQLFVPPLSRQKEIVSTLDTISSLIDNLKAEIELRKSQYEYYREKLLTFE